MKSAFDDKSFDASLWPEVPIESIKPRKRKTFRKRRSALEALLIEGSSVKEVSRNFDISVPEIYRLKNRCMAPGHNGQPYGWMGIVPDFQISRQLNHNRPRPLAQLFEKHPDIEKAVHLHFKKTGSHKLSWELFLVKCEKEYIAATDWPFSSPGLGREAIRRHLNDWSKKQSYQKHVEQKFGQSAGQTARGTRPKSKRRLISPYRCVQLDGHWVNAGTSIELTFPDGQKSVVPIGRFLVIVAIDVGSRAPLGYSITPELGHSIDDLLDCLMNCLQGWKKIENSALSSEYREGAGLPNGIFSFCEWRAFDRLQMDNALSNVSVETQDRIIETFACTVHTGLPSHPTSRSIIERFFKTLEDQSTNYVPASTGTNPKDPRRKRHVLREAVENRVLLSHLSDLIDVVIANLIVTPNKGLDGRTPRECLAQWHRFESIFVRKVPDHLQQNLPLFKKTFEVKIQGYARHGHHMYVEWMYCRYSNPELATRIDLKGVTAYLVVDRDDCRNVHLFLKGAECLGKLKPQDQWALRSHTLKERKLIGAFRNNRVKMPNPKDPIGSLRKLLTSESRTSNKAVRQVAKRQLRQGKGDEKSIHATSTSEAPKHQDNRIKITQMFQGK